MQHHFNSFSPKTRSAVSVMTYVLNLDGEGYSCFLPYDIIEDMFDFIKNMSFYVVVAGKEETEIPFDSLTQQIEHLGTVHTPYDLFLREHYEITTIWECFLSGNVFIQSLDTSGLAGVTKIGHDFLRDCTALFSVDLCGFPSVTSIGDN
eukprot:PhF_6_TR35006/c0_g1_i4/m.50916